MEIQGKYNKAKIFTDNVDGETIRAKKFSIKIVPHALTIYNDKDLINKFLS